MIQIAATSRTPILTPAAPAPGGDPAVFGVSLDALLDGPGQPVAVPGKPLPPFPVAPVSAAPSVLDTGVEPVPAAATVALAGGEAPVSSASAIDRPVPVVIAKPEEAIVAPPPPSPAPERARAADFTRSTPLVRAPDRPIPKALQRPSADLPPSQPIETREARTVDGEPKPVPVLGVTINAMPDEEAIKASHVPRPQFAARPHWPQVVRAETTVAPDLRTEPTEVPEDDASETPADPVPAAPQTPVLALVSPVATSAVLVAVPAAPLGTGLDAPVSTDAASGSAVLVVPPHRIGTPLVDTKVAFTGEPGPQDATRPTTTVFSPDPAVDGMAGSDAPKEKPPIDGALPRTALRTEPGVDPAPVIPLALLTPDGDISPPTSAAMQQGRSVVAPAPAPSSTAEGRDVAVVPAVGRADPALSPVPASTPAQPSSAGSTAPTVTPPSPGGPVPNPQASGVRPEESPRANATPRAPAPVTLVVPPLAQVPVIAAGATAPAFRLFAEAIHAARRDERSNDPLAPAPAAIVDPARAALPASSGAKLDMTDHRWPHAMIDRIEALRDAASAASDAADTSIRLVPASLGTIDVSVRREGDTVHVHFNAEQATTRALLTDAQPKLAELAESRGLKLGQSSVGAGTDQQGQRQPTQQPVRIAPTPAAAKRDEDPDIATTRVA